MSKYTRRNKSLASTAKQMTLLSEEDEELRPRLIWHSDGKHIGWLPLESRNAKSLGSVIAERMNLCINSGDLIDHIDRNPLNNTRENLRVVDRSRNGLNTDAKCVFWHKVAKKWMAQVVILRKSHYLGLFTHKSVAEDCVIKFKREYEQTY